MPLPTPKGGYVQTKGADMLHTSVLTVSVEMSFRRAMSRWESPRAISSKRAVTTGGRPRSLAMRSSAPAPHRRRTVPALAGKQCRGAACRAPTLLSG